MEKTKLCVECKDKPATHWARSFCEDCLARLLSEKIKKEC